MCYCGPEYNVNLFVCLFADGDLAHYRIPGVLQRFAICYFVVAVMQLYMPPQYEDPQVSGYTSCNDPMYLAFTAVLKTAL